MNVRQVARPLMKELADYCNGSVSMGVRDRLNMVYVESSRSGNGITTLPDIGTAVPISQSVIAAPSSPRARRPSARRCSIR